jgi:hypothetical protein
MKSTKGRYIINVISVMIPPFYAFTVILFVVKHYAPNLYHPLLYHSTKIPFEIRASTQGARIDFQSSEPKMQAKSLPGTGTGNILYAQLGRS